MIHINFPVLLIAALIPLIVGFIWYNPKLFGTVWMKEAGLTPESLAGANMLKIFGFTYILSVLAAFILQFMVIHQFGVYSVLADQPGINDATSEMGLYYADFMSKYGNTFHTFKHGVFHGVLAGIFFALPVLGINSLFDRKSFKYIAINAGFWIVTLALMGGIICQFS
jgi:hypothetical protein